MSYSPEKMLADIVAQPQMLDARLKGWLDQAHIVIESSGAQWQSIRIVGCGDSFFAALAVARAFRRATGIATEGREALEFSRYEDGVGPGMLVIGVSWSGRTSRVIEAVRRAKSAGAATIAVTNRPAGPITAEVDATLSLSVDDNEPFLPGVRSYTATLAGLYALAIALGGSRDERNVTVVDELRDGLLRSPEALSNSLRANSDFARSLSARFSDAAIEMFVGAGPNYASALYGVGKTLESCSLNSYAQQLEEWAHEQMHAAGNAMRVVLIASRLSSDRALEVASAMDRLSCQLIVVHASEDTAFEDVGLSMTVAGPLPEDLSPIAVAVPIQMYAYARSLNFPPDARRVAFDEFYRGQNQRLIYESQIRDI